MKDESYRIVALILVAVILISIGTQMRIVKHKEYIEILTEANREMLDSIKQQREHINDLEYRIERLEKAK